MSGEKPNQMLNSILSGIVLAALVGVGAAQFRAGEKLSDIRAAMMPREEIELKLHQLAIDLRAIESQNIATTRANEIRSQEVSVAISRLQFQIEQTVKVKP